MTADKKPSNWQQSIDGQWHGCPSLFEHDGTWVGDNRVKRASEYHDGRTTFWMETMFDATGPLMDRFEIGARMEFGVIDSDQDRIYTGPDFYGSGKPYGLLVDSYYYSPGWNVQLRTVNHVVPELAMQVYSSQLFEGDTLVGVFNGLYVVTQDYDSNPDTQQYVEDFLAREKVEAKRPFNLPVKYEGVFRGEFEVYDDQQNFIGTNTVTVHHRPINLLHSEQTIEISGVINRKWTALRTRNGGGHQFHGPDLHGNGKSYGRYLYSVRHVLGEAVKLWSRETVVDADYTTVCAWQFIESQRLRYTTFGVLRWEPGEHILSAHYID
ncbi:hypothetical protein [Haliea sp. E17]|uniref:hypothetical protein n=1 Tax=Haliea sp. E17 TaxID=3401576 RepID=UPI003AAC4C3B